MKITQDIRDMAASEASAAVSTTTQEPTEIQLQQVQKI
jgi:hypothetical protein